MGIAGRHHAANLVAVVDPTRVANAAIAVDEHHLGRDRRVEGLRQAEVGVGVDGKRDAVCLAVVFDVGGVIALADHAHEANALVGILSRKCTQHGAVFLRERAGGMEKRKTDRLALGAKQISKRTAVAIGRVYSQPVGRDRRGVCLASCWHRGDRISRQHHAGDEARQQPQRAGRFDHKKRIARPMALPQRSSG